MGRALLLAAIAAGLAGLWPASGSRAADFYLSGNLVNSTLQADASGSTTFFDIGGSDSDASPAYGGALGFGFALNEAAPSIWGAEMPDWGLRLEVEGITGRDYELTSNGGDGFFSEVGTWSVLSNLWLDFPAHAPISWAFGRVPILEPLTLYVGGGLGLTRIDADTTDNVSRGSDSVNNFGYQVGAGIGYAFTDWATISLGYRYHDMGEIDTSLSLGAGAPIGNHQLELRSHEFVSSLRIDFYSEPLAELVPTRWSLPRWSLPRWLPGR